MNVSLTLADSYEHITTLADHSVDFICCDPPYNLRRYSTGDIKMSWRKDFNNSIAPWDAIPFHPVEWLTEFKRVLKPTGNIAAFCSYNLLGDWHTAFDPAFDTFQMMVWHKTNPPPKLYRTGFLNSCEVIVWCWDKSHVWNFTRQSEMHNFIETGICQGKERLDCATQKPLKLMQHLIKLATRPGGLVYDPFMGVGSTGEAALMLGRRFIGAELNPHQYKQAVKRLALYYREGEV